MTNKRWPTLLQDKVRKCASVVTPFEIGFLPTISMFNMDYLSSQFKEDLWTIVEKFGERVFQMRDLEKDWASCQDDFLQGIQHIVGKRNLILSLADSGLGSSSSTSMSSASLGSSRRHSFIDFEIEGLKRDIEDMREDAEKSQKELAIARQEAEDAKAQLRQLQLQHARFAGGRDMRDGSESELPASFGKREVLVAFCRFFLFCFLHVAELFLVYTFPSQASASCGQTPHIHAIV